MIIKSNEIIKLPISHTKQVFGMWKEFEEEKPETNTFSVSWECISRPPPHAQRQLRIMALLKQTAPPSLALFQCPTNSWRTAEFNCNWLLKSLKQIQWEKGGCGGVVWGLQ